MKLTSLIATTSMLIFGASWSADANGSDKNFVIIFGDQAQLKAGQSMSTLCYENTQYTLNHNGPQQAVDGITPVTVEAMPNRPWFKLAYPGACTGLPTIEADSVALPSASPENQAYLAAGIQLYPQQLTKHTQYDANLRSFYAAVRAGGFKPRFQSVSRQWPLGGDAALLEQCFSVVAQVKPFPSMGQDFVMGQMYRRTLTLDGVSRVLLDTDLVLTSAYCECDGNPPPPCQSIQQITDINGNGRYEISAHEEQPEGMIFSLHEFNGADFSPVLAVCTGDFVYPHKDFTCPAATQP